MAEKYSHIDFKPTEAMANAAKRGLEIREKQPDSNKCCTPTGLARARQIVNRQNLSPETVKRMKAFFDRHSAFKDKHKDKTSKAWQSWQCVSGDTLVETENGPVAIKEIVENKIETKVWSFGPDGLELKAITHWHKNEAQEDEWVRVKREKKSGGGHTPYLDCTKDHQIFCNQKGFISAKNYIEGEQSLITDWLDPTQEQYLIGTLLGDASVSNISNTTACITIAQSKKQEAWFNEKIKILQPLFQGKTITTLNHKPNSLVKSHVTSLSVHSKSSQYIKQWYDSNFGRPKKVSKEIADSLTPIAVATWICDDGSLHWNKAKTESFCYRIHTEGFDDESRGNLVNALERILGEVPKGFIREVPRTNSKGKFLRLSAAYSRKLAEIISPYIPECMKYKLPKSLRSENYIADQINFEPIKDCVSLKTTEIRTVSDFEKDDIRKQSWSFRQNKEFKYDITVEDNHNFFANGMLVHNCWGGNPGKSWANARVKQMEAADKKAKGYHHDESEGETKFTTVDNEHAHTYNEGDERTSFDKGHSHQVVGDRILEENDHSHEFKD